MRNTVKNMVINNWTAAADHRGGKRSLCPANRKIKM